MFFKLLQIHSKKRSRLDHQKLQDLVYVKYNQDLLDRFECHDVIHPIALNDIDDNNEWLLGELEGEEAVNDLVFDDDDDLNQLDVAEAIGAGEPLKNTRSQTQVNKAAADLHLQMNKEKSGGSGRREWR